MGDVEIENGAAVEENTELTVTVSADSHYELAGITANGVAVEEGKYVVTEDVTFAAELNIKHSYESVVTEPTCTEGGYTTHTCTECGNSYTSDETKELGHSFTNYVSDNNATVDSDGTKTAKCDRCDATDTVIDEGSRLSVPDRITSDVYTVADGVIRKGDKVSVERNGKIIATGTAVELQMFGKSLDEGIKGDRVGIVFVLDKGVSPKSGDTVIKYKDSHIVDTSDIIN